MPLPHASLRAFLRERLEHLSLQIGERHLGSTGEEAAQEYIESELRSFGYPVKKERFDTPGWQYGAFELKLGNGESLPCFPCYFSPGGEVRSPLKTYLQSRNEPLENFAGRIAFAGNYDFSQVQDTNRLAEQLEAAGATAFIINSPYNDTFSTKIVRTPHLKRMPVITVSQRTALRLAREEGEEIRISVDAKCFDHQSCNLVARSKPEGEPRGKLVIGAHYDTSPGIQGASDNATGIALLLHLARTLRDDLGNWEVDFVAFGGEEYGGPGYGIGAYNYVEQHASDIPRIKAMICLDGIGSYLTIPEASVGRSRRLKRFIAEEAPGIVVKPFRRGSDQGIFDLHQIPTAWFSDGGAANGVRHFPLHSPQDAVDLIDWDKLTNVAQAIEGVTRRLTAEGLEEPIVSEITSLTPNDHAEVIALVRSVWTMGGDRLRETLYGHEIGAPWQEKIAKSVGDYLNLEGVEAIKVSVGGCFAGFLSYRIDTANSLGEIGYNAIHPDFLGHNLGRQLVDAALNTLRNKGVSNVEVITGLDEGHAPARAVYESAGFKPMVAQQRYTLSLKAP